MYYFFPFKGIGYVLKVTKTCADAPPEMANSFNDPLTFPLAPSSAQDC